MLLLFMTGNLVPETRRPNLDMRAGAFTMLMVVVVTASACSSTPDSVPASAAERSREADIYEAAVDFLLGDEDEVAGGYSADEEYRTFTDHPVVYVVDHTNGVVALGFCLGDDEFDEQPDVCDEMRATADQTTPLPPDVQDAVKSSLSDAERVEFVESAEQVTEPQQGIVLVRVINDGALLRFGPVIGEGSVVHLAVSCLGCGSANMWLLRLDEETGGWMVEPVAMAIA